MLERSEKHWYNEGTLHHDTIYVQKKFQISNFDGFEKIGVKMFLKDPFLGIKGITETIFLV